MAYTKYSLTPANNNAAPPDGAPEGMLPSAVNDTMRDMMAQIRDCGDGIRGGTYTMTAPVITGGSISGSTMSSNVITGGSINNTPIGASTANTGAFTTLAYSSTLTGGTGVVNLGSGQFYKDASGNIGLGTASPGYKLDVQGSVGSTIAGKTASFNAAGGSIYSAYNDGTKDWRFGNGIQAAGKVSLYNVTDAVTAFTVDSSGNVGIGTSSPSSKLTISSSTGTAEDLLSFTTAYSSPSGQKAIAWKDQGGNTLAKIGAEYSAGYGALTFGSIYAGGNNSTERMRIDGAGNLLVGTTSATSRTGATAKTVSYAAGQDTMCLKQGYNEYFALCSHVTTTSGTRFHMGFGDGATWAERGTISTNGTSTTYSTSSDYRLKENIAPMQGALDVVAQLKPVTYKWKADGSSGQGFIAHELQAVVPDCVTGEKDATRIEQYEISPAIPATFDEEGNELTPAVEAVMGEREMPVYQGIDTSFLVSTLTAAIQEQQAMINELKAKVAALEAA